MELRKRLNEIKRQLKQDIHDKEIHYMVKIDRMMKYKALLGASERDMAKIVGLSKSEVNRMSKVYRLPYKAKIYAVKMKIEKWAMIEISSMVENDQNIALKHLYAGRIKTRQDVFKAVVINER
jgi:hypothetical protein